MVTAPASRRSRNELRQLARDDPKLLGKISCFRLSCSSSAEHSLAKLGKRHHKKTHVTSVEDPEKSTKQWQPTANTKYEGDSSSYYSSSDESDSEYSEDELSEPSPLPVTRPDHPVEAVKYDSIKATWRSKYSEIDPTDIRKGLNDFWEVVRTIRDRWRTDTLAVTEAEEKKKVGELSLLRSRVKDQRDMFEAALGAVLQHGHKSIIEL